MVKLNGCLKASQGDRRKTRLTAGVGEGEGPVKSIEPGTVGICIRVCASRGKDVSNGSMLRMTASDSVSSVFSNLNSSVTWGEMKQSRCPFVVVNWAEHGGNYKYVGS